MSRGAFRTNASDPSGRRATGSGRAGAAGPWIGGGLLVAAAAGVFFGLSAHTFRYAEGLSYMSNDPRACVNCHVMRDEYDSWQKSPHHAAATCNDCHVPHDLVGKYLAKAEHGYRHSKAFTLQDFHEPIQITPGDAAMVKVNCVRCHEGLVSELVGHGGSASGKTEYADCLHCHAGIGHGPRR